MLRDFQIHFPPRDGIIGVNATISSTLLDATLHPTGTFDAVFDNFDRFEKRPGFALEAFQFESIQEYLKNQTYVRQVCELELSMARANWLKCEIQPGPTIWNDTRVSSIYFASIQHELFRPGGSAKTHSLFLVTLRVDWDEEHIQRTLTFRDGVYTGELEVDP